MDQPMKNKIVTQLQNKLARQTEAVKITEAQIEDYQRAASK